MLFSLQRKPPDNSDVKIQRLKITRGKSIPKTGRTNSEITIVRTCKKRESFK